MTVRRKVSDPPGTRRERVRDQTTVEIKQTARRLLVEHGPEGLTLRAIAREMGMTAPALYRYFGSHEEILEALCQDVMDELEQVVAAARDSVDVGDPRGRLLAACRGFRRWALEHRPEYQLTFATLLPELGPAPVDEVSLENLGFGAVFLGIFVELWQAAPFPIPEEDELPPALVAQLRTFSAQVGDPLPLGALTAYLAGWVRLYGAVTIETFGHVRFALQDPEPMFEAMLADMGRALRPAAPHRG